MYLYFDEKGTLKEQITYPVYAGSSLINKIFVYWEKSENKDISGCWGRYRKADGVYYPAISADVPYDYITEAKIPYDQDRDLKYFNYTTEYKFYVFNIPDQVLATIDENMDVQSVLFSCRFVLADEDDTPTNLETYQNDKLVPMSLVAFGIEPTTTTVSPDFNINIAQWNELIKYIQAAINVADNVVTTNTEQNIDAIKSFIEGIRFGETGDPLSNGLSSAEDGNIYWKGNKIANATEVVLLTTTQTIYGNKIFADDTEFNGNVVLEKKLVFDNSKSNANAIEIYTTDEDTGNEAVYNIKPNSGIADGGTYNIKLPNESGTLLTDASGVTLNGNQNIDGNKSFVKQIGVSSDGIQFQSSDGASTTEGRLTRYGNDLYFGDGTNANKLIKDNDTVANATHAGTATNVDDIVNNDTGANATISFTIGNKTFTKTLTVSVSGTVDSAKGVTDTIRVNGADTPISDLFENSGAAKSATNVTTNINSHAITDIFENNGTTVKNATNAANATSADEADKVANAFKIYKTGEVLPALIYDGSTEERITIGSNLSISAGGIIEAEVPTKVSDLTNDSGFITNSALTPTVLTPVTSQNITISLAGANVAVTTSGGIGSYMAPVKDGYDLHAELNDGTVTNIDQATGIISFISGLETPLLHYWYEGTKVGYDFTVGSDYNGIYVFTHDYLMMLVPIYSLTNGQIYKFTGPGLQDAQGSVTNLIHNMQRDGTHLYIWSGNKDYPMISGRIGTLVKVKLY